MFGSVSPAGAQKGEGDTCPTSEGDHAPSVSRTFFRVNIQAQSWRPVHQPERLAFRPSVHGRSAPEFLLTFIIPSAKQARLIHRHTFPMVKTLENF